MTISMTLAETAHISRTQRPAEKKPSRNRFMAFLVAAATAFAMIMASGMPARAERGNNDAIKALAAIAAIALIAKAVKDKKRRHAPPTPVQLPRVPRNCAIEIGSGVGSVIGYSERCLREEGFNYRLPNGCATSLRIFGRADNFFTEQCLRDAGFNTPAR